MPRTGDFLFQEEIIINKKRGTKKRKTLRYVIFWVNEIRRGYMNDDGDDNEHPVTQCQKLSFFVTEYTRIFNRIKWCIWIFLITMENFSSNSNSNFDKHLINLLNNMNFYFTYNNNNSHTENKWKKFSIYYFIQFSS